MNRIALSPAERLKCTLLLPGRRPSDVFGFFADAANLEKLTPPFLRFRVLTPAPIEMHDGTLIDYRLRVHGLPLRWRSRITAWNPPHAFADVQVRGPYLRWEHLHTFEETPDGTLVRDDVRFRVFAGLLVGPLVRADLRQIFAYRSKVLSETFGGATAPQVSLTRVAA